MTDWVDVVAYDLKADERLECLLKALPENYTFFLPLAGFEKATIYSENPADVKAAEQMGRLFDLIKERNPPKTPEDIHVLNVFLTRLLFCFFAEDTGIFEADQVSTAIASFTSEDGSDVAKFYTELFEVLNEPDTSAIRQSKPGYLKAFPYVNGGLFRNKLPVPEFGAKARRILLDCGALQWSEINPDIFGSMFQSVIDEDQRGNLGQHYTSVTNIMKVIQPLFLDKLEAELDASRSSEAKLKQLLDRISKIKVFDPACGSGNFLIIAYKELRKIEMAVFKALDEVSRQKVMFMSNIKLSQFHGIEIDDFAHEIALLSLWLTEHQMNQAFRNEFGYSAPTLPLKDAGHIVHGNSLRLNWDAICHKTKDDEVYVCGNPPFLGKGDRNSSQTSDLEYVFGSANGVKNLDFVTCWFYKAANYVANSHAESGLVSTNSICQGEQVGVLWPLIFNMNVFIRYAYQTFQWTNNAKSNAAVHVVIIGMSSSSTNKLLYTNHDGAWHAKSVSNIGPYLTEFGKLPLTSRKKPISQAPEMLFGSMPNDGGHLLLDSHEYKVLTEMYPESKKLIRPLLGSEEFLHNKERYCLWLDGDSNEWKSIPPISERVDKVRQARLESTRASTKALANTPHLFGEIRHPRNGSYILVPQITSERRVYVPIAFISANTISSNRNQTIPHATLFDFGIIQSTMHMDWMRAVCGRLESRFNYSASIVYNNFPWPESSGQRSKDIEVLAENLILIREDYPDKTLAQLYDPDLMPSPLLAAHQALDAAVEKLYRDKPFKDSSERLEHLFARYEKLVATENNKKLK